MQQTKPLHLYVEALAALLVDAHLPSNDQAITSVTADSRQVQTGGMFVAISGDNLDGHNFIDSAVNNGAVALVTTRCVKAPPHIAVLRVTNGYHAAGVLAEVSYNYPAQSLNVFGVTGTNGKTTCAHLLQTILMHETNTTVGMVGTIEHHIGPDKLIASRTTPPAFEIQKLMAIMRDHNVKDCVLEVSSHALDQQRLGTARCNGALFTNLSGDHCDYHGTMERYAEAKAKLFRQHLASNGKGIINTDCPFGQNLFHDLADTHLAPNLFSVGTAQHNDYLITDSETDTNGSRFILHCYRPGHEKQLQLSSPMIGAFNIENIAGCSALALACGISETAISQAVEQFHGARGRLQTIPVKNAIRCVIDYAHTDDALQNVLETLKALAPTRLSVIFGCGGDRDKTKRPRMASVAANLADQLYITSDNPRTENPETILQEIVTGIPPGIPFYQNIDRRQTITEAIQNAVPGEIILVAGKGHEDYQEIMGSKHHFDDAEEVRRALNHSNLL